MNYTLYEEIVNVLISYLLLVICAVGIVGLILGIINDFNLIKFVAYNIGIIWLLRLFMEMCIIIDEIVLGN